MPLFGKKQTVQALAELIDDGRAIMNEQLKRPKYNEYRGPEPMFEMLVRVYPKDEPPFEAKMKAGLSKSFLLKPGVRVQVRYDAGSHEHVELDDDIQSITARNPQLIKQA